jgi:hypothetical protein
MRAVPHPSRPLESWAASGDWVCTRGDIAELAYVARVMAERFGEPLHCELVAFADRCAVAPAQVVAEWPGLRERLFG